MTTKKRERPTLARKGNKRADHQRGQVYRIPNNRLRKAR